MDFLSLEMFWRKSISMCQSPVSVFAICHCFGVRKLHTTVGAALTCTLGYGHSNGIFWP